MAKNQKAVRLQPADVISENILLHLAFDNSLQANLISTVTDQKIILANRSAAKLFGYSKKQLLTKNWASVFKTNETGFKKMLKQRKTEGHSIALVTAVKKNGKNIICEITSAVFNEPNGREKTITTIVDMSLHILTQKNIDSKKEREIAGDIVIAKSKQKNIDRKKKKIVSDNISLSHERQKNIDIKKEKIVAENILLAQNENSKWKKYIGKTSFDVMWDWNITTGNIYIGDSLEEVFGYKAENNTIRFLDFMGCLPQPERGTVEKRLLTTLASAGKSWNDAYMLKRRDGSLAFAVSRASIIRDENGAAIHLIGATKDVSILRKLELKLEEELQLKEKNITEASDNAKDDERSDIGKELHDNINQLLGASQMYLDLSKRGGENSGMYLSRSAEYTSTAIEEIRKLSKALTNDNIKELGLCEAIVNITKDTMEVSPVKISFELKNFSEDSVNNKFKLNIFRIVQEQLSNILKHANAKEVSIALLQNKKSIILTIADNGVGFDTDKKQKGIGIANTKNRAASYDGTADFVSKPGQGCVLTVTFPVKKPLPDKALLPVTKK